jgi:histidine phosphotransferase ChpT
MSDTIDRAIALELASLLCSRLCHDMLSPVGALSNGLELLAEEKDPAMRERCFELLEQSARTSANKLKFYRLAFGAAGGFGDMIPVAEPRALIEALLYGKDRVSVNFALGNDMLPKSAVKTLLNFALIAIDGLVRGGTIDIAAEVREGAAELVVRAAGPRIAFDPAIGLALEGRLEPGDLSSKTAPAAMLQVMATGLGGNIQYALSDEALVMGAVIPVG